MMMRRRWCASLRPVALALALGPGLAGASWALTFREAYDAARGYDAQYRAANYERESTQLNLPIARSQLYPQISLSGSTAEVTGKREFPNSLNQEFRTRLDYGSTQTALQLRMPIFNYDSLSRVRIAEAQSEGAESTYLARGLDLVDRLTTAYLQVLLAQEALALAESQTVTLNSQLERGRQRFARGEGTRIEVAQTQSALSVGEARRLEAADQVRVAQRDLKRQIGIEVPPLQQMAPDYVPQSMLPERLEEWLDQAYRNNPTLRAKEQALVAARMNVQRNFAGHLPRLDLVASVGRTSSDSLSTLNQTAVQRSLGVQFNLPLYSGGGVDASVKQALADQGRAEEDIRAQREAIAVELQRQFLAVNNGQTKIAAYRSAVDAQAVVVTGLTRAIDAGLATSTDLLDAQSKLYSASRDWLQVRYEYLLSRVRLNAQAGAAMTDIAADIDGILTASPRLADGSGK